MLQTTSTTPDAIAELPANRPLHWRLWQSVAATARKGVAFAAHHKMWLACMATVVLAWTIELYAVQAKTLIYPNEVGVRFAFWAPKVRLTLDLLFISMLTLWLPRRVLYAVLVGAFFVYLSLVTYFQYFQRPISLLTIFTNWREGLEVSGFALDMFPKRAALLMIAALGVQVSALYLSRRAVLPRDCARLAAGLLAVCYVALYLGVNKWDPLTTIQTKRGVGRLGAMRGYLGPWAAEWYYLGDRQVLERALEVRKTRYDRLTPIEADIPVHDRLVILQAESLDFNILGHKVNGVAVTPFLNRLRDISMFYRVRAMHYNGSSDADFVAMNAVACSKHENTYMIPGYPYENTTPQLLARCGFATTSFHGHSGQFYRRRAAFEKMGFDNIYFREELERPPYSMRVDRWGATDKDVLLLSALKMRESKSPTCHFVITLTTHSPYTMLPSSEREIFANPSTTYEHYMNNMRYLDNCLRDYFTTLGNGTTIMLYADHPAEQGITDGVFAPDRSDGREFIPCYIYDTDRDLSKLQKTRKNPIRRDGTINLVDMINYLRGQVELQFGDREFDLDDENTRKDRPEAATAIP